MANRPVEGISIQDSDGRVIIEIPGGQWEGEASEAERLLTTLHYALNRARPGTNIVSLFVNGELWGEKVLEDDQEVALEGVGHILARLVDHVEQLRRAASDPIE